MSKKTLKYIIAAITYAILLFFILWNFNEAKNVVSNFFYIITPFIYGFIVAYLLNVPYVFFKDKAFAKIGSKRTKLSSIRKPLAMVCTYILVFGIITFLLLILIPEVVNSIQNVFNNFDSYAEQFQKAEGELIQWINNQFGLNLDNQTIIDNIVDFITTTIKKQDFGELISDWAGKAFPIAFDYAKNVTVSIYNWVIAIIVSIYLLSSKEKLLYQTRKLSNAYIPKKILPRVFKVVTISHDMCGKYIIGRILDSALIGLLCFILMSIFKFDYALLISVIIGITNIIPFFGPFIGAIPSAFLLLLINPVQCFWFIIFILVLQQIDANILEPKIVGDSVGISGIWILVSVIIGGGLFGIVGMILGVPVFAVIYILVGENANNRLNKTDLPKEPITVESEDDSKNL